MNEEQQRGADEFAARAIDGDGVLGHYVVIAEMVHEKGTTLNFAVSDGLPPWTAMGMLQSVMAMVDVATFEYVEGPEDDDI